jgi:hypothetical protein
LGNSFAGDDFQERGILNLTAYNKEESYNFSISFSAINRSLMADYLNATRSYNASIFHWDITDAHKEIISGMLEEDWIVFTLQAIFSKVTAQYLHSLLFNEAE